VSRPHSVLRTASAALAAATVVALAAAPLARADGDADDFRQSCASCHTIGGGRLVGPDLKDVTKRQRREWLVRFIQDPQGVIASGDPYAAKLLAESRNVMMAPVAGMTAKRADALLALIEAESKLEKSKFATTGLSDRPFTAQDVAVGRELFLGTRRLGGGGAACISCHSAGDAGALGGGRLGPNLTDAFARLGGRAPLGAWFLNPPTPTMKPLFSAKPLDPEAEVLSILAFLKDAADRNPAPNVAAQRLTFVLLATALAGALLLLAQVAWRTRFRSVRAALVERATGRRGPLPEEHRA
jgi:cytochrome c2